MKPIRFVPVLALLLAASLVSFPGFAAAVSGPEVPDNPAEVPPPEPAPAGEPPLPMELPLLPGEEPVPGIDVEPSPLHPLPLPLPEEAGVPEDLAGVEETPAAAVAGPPPRLCVLTDIGGDPDDRQSLIRLLVYANEFEIEGLIASAAGTPGELKKSITRPDLIRELIAAYGRVRPRLLAKAAGWPEVESLKAVVKSGNPRRGREAVGKGQDTEGSEWLLARIDAGTAERPLNVSIWGGQTDLAQVLWKVKSERGPEEFAEFVRKFRVYDIADQDGLAAWMRTEFPGMFYILSKAPEGRDRREATFRGMYLGGNATLTSESWTERRIRSQGPLGAMYPIKTATAPNPHCCVKEGDTPSWFFFLPRGGNDPADPTKPGWGGQFQKEPDGWFTDLPRTDDQDPRTAVSRWRPAFQADFAKRMAWCLGK